MAARKRKHSKAAKASVRGAMKKRKQAIATGLSEARRSDRAHDFTALQFEPARVVVIYEEYHPSALDIEEPIAICIDGDVELNLAIQRLQNIGLAFQRVDISRKARPHDKIRLASLGLPFARLGAERTITCFVDDLNTFPSSTLV